MSTKPNKSKLAAPGRETPAAEAVTVAWTMAVMTTFLCDVGTAVTRILVQVYAAPTTDTLAPMAILSGLLFLAAGIIGLVSLALLPAVLVLRRERPPLAFLVFAVVSAATPLAMALAAQLT